MHSHDKRMVTKYNQTAICLPCAICGDITHFPDGPAVAHAIRGDLVCLACGSRYAPELIKALGVYVTGQDALLRHYCKKHPRPFIQLDVFDSLPRDDTTDVDGDSLFYSATTELMVGAAVRQLIRPGTSIDTYERAIKKASELVNMHPEILDLSQYYDPRT